eukprot:5538977-Amphidinium_carterae.1
MPRRAIADLFHDIGQTVVKIALSDVCVALSCSLVQRSTALMSSPHTLMTNLTDQSRHSLLLLLLLLILTKESCWFTIAMLFMGITSPLSAPARFVWVGVAPQDPRRAIGRSLPLLATYVAVAVEAPAEGHSTAVPAAQH